MSKVFYCPVPLCLDQNGMYATKTSDVPPWTYLFEIEAVGTKSERRTGTLTFDSKAIPASPENAELSTPWGRMCAHSSMYWRGWLAKKPGASVDEPPQANPPLPIGGVWLSTVANWKYWVEITNPESKSETRVGKLYRDGNEITGNKDAETVKTPWGLGRWCAVSQYEQGWLFVRTYDRPWQT